MTAKPREDDHDRFLLVEGYSDLTFVAELLEQMGFPQAGQPGACYIKDCKSKTQLLDVVESWIDPERLVTARAIGVLVDADAAPSGTGVRLAALLKKVAGAKLGRDGGWAQSNGRAQVGFMVVPGGTADEVGELETLVWRAWASSDANAAKRTCIESFLECMDKAGACPKSTDKARIGSLLAIENDDDPRLGPGARAKRFDLGAPAYEPLRTFLRGLQVV